jgi:hypothetical protein
MMPKALVVKLIFMELDCEEFNSKQRELRFNSSFVENIINDEPLE